MGPQKLGQPVPESNFALEAKSVWPQPAQGAGEGRLGAPLAHDPELLRGEILPPLVVGLEDPVVHGVLSSLDPS
jgi:hypothetical protein